MEYYSCSLALKIYTKNHKTCILLLLSVIKIVNKKGSKNTPLNTQSFMIVLTLFFLTVYFQHPVESRHFSLLLTLDVLWPQQYLTIDPVDPQE